jgi:hypothetical protein
MQSSIMCLKKICFLVLPQWTEKGGQKQFPVTKSLLNRDYVRYVDSIIKKIGFELNKIKSSISNSSVGDSFVSSKSLKE